VAPKARLAPTAAGALRLPPERLLSSCEACRGLGVSPQGGARAKDPPLSNRQASGVAFFNKTAPAEALLTAWAEVMAYPPNSAAPDDQAMDEIVNGDGWIDRVTWGWLPAKYLRMAHRHASAMPTADDCVLNHDRDAMPGRGNSPIKPVLPPHAFDHSEL
jgi:hypothetical protein